MIDKVYEWLTIHHDSCELRDSEMVCLQQNLANIYELSPTQSTIHFYVEKRLGFIKAKIIIQSYLHHFEASGKDRDFKKLLKSLCSEIMNQIENWREERNIFLGAV